MFRVIIKNLENIQTHGGEFKTLQEANAWIAEIEPTGAWGYVGNEEYVNEIGETVPARAKEYSIEIVDITEEIKNEKEKEKALKAQQFGAEIIAKVWQINEAKKLSQSQFLNLILDANLARIERLLWSGSLKTAKALIVGLNSTYFTTAEKQEIISLIDKKILDL